MCAQKNGPKEVWISLVLDPTTLDMQQSLFVLTMKNNSKGAMVEPHPSNPFISVWRQLTTSQFVVQRMLECIKLSKLQLFKFLTLWKMNIVLVHWVYEKQIQELVDNTFWILSFKCLLKILKLLKFSLRSNYWRVEGCP